MSVYGDFRNVWVQRFPGSDLPAAWEDDVRANLAKHRQKVAVLREELEKEEFYVEYLERLLVDVEKFKVQTSDDAGGEDVTEENSESKDGPLDLGLEEESVETGEVKQIRDSTRNSVDHCVGEVGLGLSLSRTTSEDSSKSIAQSEYVTVIEVPASIGEDESSEAEEEPYYDSVPADEGVDTKLSNYVNIDYFIHQPSEDGSEKTAMMGRVVDTLLDSEKTYLECLAVLLQYMKALKATLTTSQPVINENELNTIFFQIPELHTLHRSFLDAMQRKDLIGQQLKTIASQLEAYKAFLHNYNRALEAVRQCSSRNHQFADITDHIRLNGRSVSLAELLHKPVARIQRMSPLISDLLEYCSDGDRAELSEALELTRRFLDDFNVSRTQALWPPVKPDAARRLVKNSFVVEVSNSGGRKLRHLFLFNDLLAAAKYKAAASQRFDLELKWYCPVAECSVSVDEGAGPCEQVPLLKMQARTLRDRIHWEQTAGKRCDRLRKKLRELEGQLVLWLPGLGLKLNQRQVLLSSEHERDAWLGAVDALKAIGGTPPPFRHSEIQALVSAASPDLELGSYLPRSPVDPPLFYGDLVLSVDRPASVEADSYGHFFPVGQPPQQTFTLQLEGAQTLRFHVHHARSVLKLNPAWLTDKGEVCKEVPLQGYTPLVLSLRFVPREVAPRRAPTQFGASISQVHKQEKRAVPWVIAVCVGEVERRGLDEIGIYRVSGSASDLLKLRKAFETDVYSAEVLVRETDIHTVTGVLKLYLRQLPEGMFTSKLYPKLVDAFQVPDRQKRVKAVLGDLPTVNKHIVAFLLAHLLRVNASERRNKMSLQNLATIFGPTLLRAGPESDKQRDPLAAGTVDAMAQASLLHFLLQHSILP